MKAEILCLFLVISMTVCKKDSCDKEDEVCKKAKKLKSEYFEMIDLILYEFECDCSYSAMNEFAMQKSVHLKKRHYSVFTFVAVSNIHKLFVNSRDQLFTDKHKFKRLNMASLIPYG